jgi:hypothetical protein
VNNRQLAQIGLGLLGVWSLLSAVATFIQIGVVVGVSAARLGIAEVIPVALLLGISYLLVFHNAQVAAAIFPDVEANAGGAPTWDISRTLVALTGVLLLVDAAPGVLNTILNYFTAGAIDPALRGQLAGRLIGLLVPIAAGIYLIARPDRLLDYLQRPAPAEVPNSE